MKLKKYKTRELRTLSLLVLVALLAVLSAPSLTDSLTYAQAPPPELTATSRMANQADLSWTEVSGATYVIVRQDRTTRRWETLESSYSGTTYTDTTAPAGTRYAYLISADGRNSWSNPETVFVGFYDAPTLNAPTASTLPSKIDVSWSTVAGTDNYDLWRHEQTEGWVQVADGQTGTTYADSAVDIGKTYLYQVQAHGALGAGAWSDQRSASVPSTAPGMPLNLVATAGNAEVMLEWNEPVSDGGSAITAYEYRYQMAGGSWSNWTDTIPALSRTVTIGSLTNDSAHNFEVRAENAIGAGAIATASATPMSTVPGIPAGLGVTSTGPTEITLSWTAVDGATSYQLQRRTNGGTFGSPMDAGSGITYTDMDLAPSTTYDYEVRAVNAAGSSGWSGVVTSSTTAPTAPDMPTLNASASADKITLSWTAPASNGAAITGYDLDVSDDGTDDSWSDLSTPAAGDTSAEHTGLAPGTMKYYRLRAMNSVGYSDWSASVMDTVAAVAPGKPSLSASAAGTTITLNWVAPASNGGAAITGYTLQVSNTGADPWSTRTSSLAADATSYEHTGLRAGDTRYYRINARNSVGSGEWSDVDSATIGGADPPAGETPDASSPRFLSVTPDALASDAGPGTTMTSISLSWQEPTTWPTDDDDTNNDGRTYAVEVWNDATQAWGPVKNATSETDNTPVDPTITPVTTPVGATTTDTGLMGTTKYTYRVRAVDGTAMGSWSTQEHTTTVPVSPPKPVLSGTAPEFGKIMLSWTVSGDGGSPIIGYELQILHGADPTTGTWEDYIGADGSWRDAGTLATETAVLLDAPQQSVTQSLDPMTGAHGTPHHYRIRAVNGIADATAGTDNAARSDWSDVRSVTAATGVPQDEATVTITPAAGSVQFELTGQTTSTGGSAILSNELQEWDPEAQEWKTVADSLTIDYTKSDLGGMVTVKFRYRTRNANGYSKWFMEEGTTPAGAPSAPKLTATVNGPDSISLSWTKPNNGGTAITGYIVEASEMGGTDFTPLTGDAAAGLPAVADTTADTLTATHTGTGTEALTAGITRYYRVRATNGTEGPNSKIVMATTTTGGVPGAPTWATDHPEASTTSSMMISLEWVAPASDGGSAITGYDLAVWEDGDWNTFETGLATDPLEYNHGGRAGMTTYYYRVRARNANGPGLWSAPGSATTIAGAPSKPMMLTATPDGPDKIKLTWEAPANGGNPITAYLVQVSNSRTAGWGPFDAAAGDNVTIGAVVHTLVGKATDAEPAPPLTVTHTGLTGMTTKYYRVRATNAATPASAVAADTGPWSDVMSATTPAGKPDMVVLADAPGTELADKVVLTWTAPANGGSAITAYHVQYWMNGAWMDLMSVGGSATTYTHEPVAGSTTNYYRVRAVNAEGEGPWSATQTRTTVAGKPGASVLNAGANGSSEIRLTWTIPASGGDDVTHYDIQYSSDGASGWTWDQDGSSIQGGLRVLRAAIADAAQQYSHTGLDPSTTRHYRVRAVNGNGEGPWSNVAMAMTAGGKPGKPTLTASASGTTMISLSWKPPAGDGGSPITGYEIEYWDGSNGWMDLAMPAAGATTHIHRNLSGGMTKYYRIRAMNAAGSGAWSTIAHATTETSAPAPPALIAMADGQTKIVLTWTAGASGGLPTTEYHLQHSTNAGRAWADVDLGTDKMVMTYTDMGLTGGTTKHYRVRAMNSKGWSGWSPLASDTTDVSVPGRPELTVTGQTRGRILLDWEAATGGAAIIRYEIQRWDSEARRWVDLPSTSATSYTDTGRMSTKKYFYRVRAVNRIGDGPWSTFGNGSPTSN
ncbi:MAG: fibronectin type III domain-containing protein [Caldilineaceae bacterium]|nr:fibronectin type III domain-containing protein [Caldilineaceae bacterium]